MPEPLTALDAFHPTIRQWFAEEIGEPSAPQRQGWPAIQRGEHTLIAAPTGSGKTLAAFLVALDQLLSHDGALPDECRVLYVSPLKALGNDVQKNLQAPLAALRARDPSLPEVQVMVRSGDTAQKDRTAMLRRPPHILVTTPESLYILLTSDGGRRVLRTVRTCIVDEIHAMARDKRGAHLALSLERLDHLAAAAGHPIQRIGLSATQRPIEETAGLLVGEGRPSTIVDCGHLRALDLAMEVPDNPLEAVCSSETWEQIYARICELIDQHTTTLVFVQTRKLAERVAARLTEVLGEDHVTSHHGSLSKERRLDAEQRLKGGTLKALVATASLELGIDVGEVDLVVQVGVPATIATFLQRVGRAGHSAGKTPKGRMFPLTADELVTGAALLRCVHRRELDRTIQAHQPLDILAQQIVAACVPETWSEDELYRVVCRARPYRDLSREDFDATVALHTSGRYALLHRAVAGREDARLRGTKRARLPALTAGGAIPDITDYRVVEDPEGVFVGTVNEDFAIESSIGDVFQLGNTSWKIHRIGQGELRVSNAHGVPPSLPFWFGEAPARTEELSAAVSEVRERGRDRAWLERECEIPASAAEQIARWIEEGVRVLGAVPTRDRLVLERFFDQSGGQQLVLHSPYGGRINRGLGLALRKRFCRSFGFELQAAANEDAILISLGPMHSFELADVFQYLHPNTVREVLVQALLPAPMFQTRWRWNVTRSLVVERTKGGARVPSPLLRMRADDALADAFPHAQACPETLESHDLEVPWDHPVVRQTVLDCLHEAMDIDGLERLVARIRSADLELLAVDTAEPSSFCAAILNAAPYSFLDDAPLEERRTQAVLRPRGPLQDHTAEIGDLDRAAVQRVRDEAWPDPADAEELHEALLWMGWCEHREAVRDGWEGWLAALRQDGRVLRDGNRWFAAEADRADGKALLRGRLEALGPVVLDDPLLLALEADGIAMRCRLDGERAWCDRRLLARVHRYMVESLRERVRPVAPAVHERFVERWQHEALGSALEGPLGLSEILEQWAGVEVPVRDWESKLLRRRVRDYRREWLDQLTLSGEFVWLRLWSRGRGPISTCPMAIVPRRDLASWLDLSAQVRGPAEALGGAAAQIRDALQGGGALFPTDLQQSTGLLPSWFEEGLAELIGQGLAACDSFAALRQLAVPPSRRKFPVHAVGRWGLVDRTDASSSPAGARDLSEPLAEFVADRLLHRWGVVFPKLLQRERMPTPWRPLLRVLRRRELRGDIRGGRFVASYSGEQFALPQAIPQLRSETFVPGQNVSPASV